MGSERSGYVPPGFLMARVVNPMVRAFGAPTLTVRGRRTGRRISIPVNPLDQGGVVYLVAGSGETHWVRNLRAAGEGELRRKRAVQRFRAVELQGDEHDRVVTAYRVAMGRRVSALFKRLPDPVDHPAFRVDPIAPSG